MELNKETMKLLQAPFPANEIKLKIQAGGKNGSALVVAYIDARNVMDRLDEVFEGNWSDSYQSVELGAKDGIQCTITIDGVIRRCWPERCRGS